MVITDASGLPLAVHTDSTRPHEVTLVQATLDEIVTVGQPRAPAAALMKFPVTSARQEQKKKPPLLSQRRGGCIQRVHFGGGTIPTSIPHHHWFSEEVRYRGKNSSTNPMSLVGALPAQHADSDYGRQAEEQDQQVVGRR